MITEDFFNPLCDAGHIKLISALFITQLQYRRKFSSACETHIVHWNKAYISQCVSHPTLLLDPTFC